MDLSTVPLLNGRIVTDVSHELMVSEGVIGNLGMNRSPCLEVTDGRWICSRSLE